MGGSARDIVIGSGKLGKLFLRQADRRGAVGYTGGPAPQRRPQVDTRGEDRDRGSGFYGGVETPMALADGVVFVPVVNVPTDYTATA